jgi:acetylornithine/succinyldiaminopimelate/putrescine aminotransferase
MKEKTVPTSSGFEGVAGAFRRHLAATSAEPIGVLVDRAEGPWIYTPDGRRYLDLLSGIGVANLGHTHPAVVAAVRRQNERHHHVMVYGEYILEEQARYAAELAGVTPAGLDTVFFVNSGAEAVEGALKTARKATGRSRFVAFEGAYHGDTMGALSVAGNPSFQDPFRPLVEPVSMLPFGDVGALEAIDERTAAVIVEPVQGEGGVRIPPEEFLPALSGRCQETGALLIFDEVMTGFGRTGRLFACEHRGVAPDLLVLAKALGGGYPLGAFIGRRELLNILTHDPPLAHVTTFGGHPVSCAAGRAALRVLLEENLPTRAETVGESFRNQLRESLVPLGAEDVRGVGLFIGIELPSADITRRFTDGCRERDILLGWTLHTDRVVRLAPPLNTPESVLADAATTMASVLSSL